MESKECIAKMSAHLFWDMDMSMVNMDQCPAQIIQRVLEYGTWEDWCIIRSYYGLQRIVETCRNLRTLDAKALSYICCISNTVKEEYRCYHIKQSNPTLWKC